MKRVSSYLSPRYLLLAAANGFFNLLLCLLLMITLGAGALASSLLLVSAFFGDRFCDLLGPKLAVRGRLKALSPASSPSTRSGDSPHGQGNRQSQGSGDRHQET